MKSIKTLLLAYVLLSNTVSRATYAATHEDKNKSVVNINENVKNAEQVLCVCIENSCECEKDEKKTLSRNDKQQGDKNENISTR